MFLSDAERSSASSRLQGVRRTTVNGGAARRSPTVIPGVYSSDPKPSAVIRVVEFEEVREDGARIPLAPAAVEATSTSTQAPEQESIARDQELIARIQEEAYQRGLEEAQRELREEREKIAGIRKLADTVFSDLREAFAQTETSRCKDEIRLALMIAEKIVRRELFQNHESLASAVARAIESAEGNEPISIVCSPETAAKLRSMLSDLSRDLQIETIQVEEDPRFEAGDFMLWRGAVTLDARLSTRLARIERALSRELGIELSPEAKHT